MLSLMAGAAAMPFLNTMALGSGVTGTVRVWTFLSPDGSAPREVVLRSIIESFTAANPGVSIVVEPQPSTELETKFIAAAQQGRAPDVIWMRDTFLGLVESRNILLDLNEALSSEFRAAAIPDLFQVFAEKSVFGGRRISLPIWPSPSQIPFYRGDALEEIGLEAPPLEWWSFVDAAARLTQGDRFGLGLPTKSQDNSSLVNIMAGFGPSFIDPDTSTLNLTGPEALEAARVIRELVARNALSKSLINAWGDDIQDQFAAGRFAIAQAFGPRFPQFKAAAAAYDPSRLAVSAWPAFGDRPPAVLLGGYWTVGISAATQNKEAATAFVEALYSPEASLEWSKTASLVPDRRSVLTDPWYATETTGTISRFVQLLSEPGAMTLPAQMPKSSEAFTTINIALEELIGTDEDPASILGRAASTLGW
jgi:multiple sugar transport system substrate-binding protein